MDFIGPFPRSKGFDYLWVVICRLTSMVHMVPVNTTTKASELASLYVKEVVRLHSLPDSIVSDRDSKFTSMFWRETHRILGTKLLMSTLRQSTSAGHPRLTTGIPMGMETCGSESLVITGRHGSGFLSGCCEYLPQVLVSLLFIYLF